LELDANLIAVRRGKLKEVARKIGLDGDFHHAGFEGRNNEPVSIAEISARGADVPAALPAKPSNAVIRRHAVLVIGPIDPLKRISKFWRVAAPVICVLVTVAKSRLPLGHGILGAVRGTMFALADIEHIRAGVAPETINDDKEGIPAKERNVLNS
jgi:hypothetical protein